MPIFKNKVLNELEIKNPDGTTVEDDDDVEATDYNDPDGNEQDAPTPDQSTDDPDSDTEDNPDDAPTDYTVEDDDDPDATDDNPEDNDTGDDTGEDEEGGDDAPTDYTVEDDEEPTDGEEGTDDNTDEPTDYTDDNPEDGDSDDTGEEGTDDELTDGDSTNDKMKKLEEELFADLSPEQLQIKNKELKSQYLKIYDDSKVIVDRLNNIEKTEQNMSILRFASEKLSELRVLILEYLTSTYNTKSYIQNLENVNYYLAILSGVDAIIATIKDEK